jgi:hypothetical protein
MYMCDAMNGKRAVPLDRRRRSCPVRTTRDMPLGACVCQRTITSTTSRVERSQTQPHLRLPQPPFKPLPPPYYTHTPSAYFILIRFYAYADTTSPRFSTRVQCANANGPLYNFRGFRGACQ